MSTWTISLEDYRDKVCGCFMGKNIGGTLGAPVEGRMEVFDFDFYPELREGGIPNDDLEMQLIWLKCLQEAGPQFTARDLAEYWLDHIFYNPDEYGFCKANMRKHLVPPVTGSYNNWFNESMGCPIRSEIWACVAPGAPDVAAALSFRDGIVDHTTESVWAEMFFAAIESAAFVIPDRAQLIDIGLSMIPPNCRTARAVTDTIRWHNESADWTTVRANIIDRYGHTNCTDSTQNIAFTILGWLAGADFGSAICSAVNCGYDTDCTGATLGAILGIIHGRSSLPDKWTQPLGDNIIISSGIGNFQPPADLAELTDQVVEQGKKVLAYFGRDVKFARTGKSSAPADLTGPGIARPLWDARWDAVRHTRPGLEIEIDYRGLPTIAAGVPKTIAVKLKNCNAVPVEARLDIHGPRGWQMESGEEWVSVDPGDEIEWETIIECTDPRSVQVSNLFVACPELKDRPAVGPVSFALVGEMKWQVSMSEKPTDADWQTVTYPEFGMDVEHFFNGKPGTLHMRHFVKSPDDRKIRISVYNTEPVKVFLNGDLAHSSTNRGPIRPNFGGWGDSVAFVDLKKGWNEFILQVERADKPLDHVHFTMSSVDLAAGFADLINTYFPWEEEAEQ